MLRLWIIGITVRFILFVLWVNELVPQWINNPFFSILVFWISVRVKTGETKTILVIETIAWWWHIKIQGWKCFVYLLAICNFLWANRSCRWCRNEIKMPQRSSSKRCSSRISVIVKLKKFGNKGWACMFNNNLRKYFALFLKYDYHSYRKIATCFQWHQRRSTFRSKQNHRWPKRNMGHLWRNMRVCMGKIELQTDEINEVKAIKVINKV